MGRPVSVVKAFVHPVQVAVGQQRADDTPLRGAGSPVDFPRRLMPIARFVHDRLQDQLGRRLDDPITHAGDAQRALPSIRLGDHLQPYRLRAVAFGFQGLAQFLQVALAPAGGVLDVLYANTIHTGCTVVGGHLAPCRRKHVGPRDPVIPGVEPKARLLLRFDVQSLPPLEDFLRQAQPVHALMTSRLVLTSAAWPPATCVSRPFSVQPVTAYGAQLRCPRFASLRTGPFPNRSRSPRFVTSTR